MQKSTTLLILFPMLIGFAALKYIYQPHFSAIYGAILLSTALSLQYL